MPARSEPRPKRLFLTDERAIRLLLGAKTNRIMDGYMYEARTVAEAAKAVKVSVSTTAYRTQQLLEAGLLTEVDSERRGTREFPRYQASADEFIVQGQRGVAHYLSDPAVMTAEAEAYGQLQRNVARHWELQGEQAVLRYTAVNDFVSTIELLSTDDLDGNGSTPLVLDTWFRCRLPPDKIEEFRRELFALQQRITESIVDDRNVPTIIGHLAFVRDYDAVPRENP